MSKAYIAKTLKRLREKTKMTADEVGAIIGKSGKTVNAWENERGQPDAEMLIRLSKIYNVKNLLLEFDENQEIEVSLPESIKVDNIIMSDEKQLLEYYRGFDSDGKEEALKRLSEMAQLEKYKKGIGYKCMEEEA